MGKSEVVGSVGFMLRWYMKSVYIDMVLPDNTTGWNKTGSTSTTRSWRFQQGLGTHLF
jgi:hypothetical protein